MNRSIDETTEAVEAVRAESDFDLRALDRDEWRLAPPIRIVRYWSGEDAPPERHAEARLLWTDEALYARFACRQAEPLVVNQYPQLARKSVGLWERDVCELFIAPEAHAPERYYEFEAAPTGEWLDLKLRLTPEGRETVWDFDSGMTAAGRITEGRIHVAIRVPWRAFDVRAPRAGEVWRANLYRCVGAGPSRGYLAWRPTHTPEPLFHVPEKFGPLKFV